MWAEWLALGVLSNSPNAVVDGFADSALMDFLGVPDSFDEFDPTAGDERIRTLPHGQPAISVFVSLRPDEPPEPHIRGCAVANGRTTPHLHYLYCT